MTSNAPDLSIDPTELDHITGEKALAWAGAWSDRTEANFQDKQLAARIRDALDTDDKIPYVTRRGGFLYNVWRDREHPRGIWRRTTPESYEEGHDEWEVLVDVDKLARV
ncbi:hypothetical protein [Corynebacterium appendicis]|uniref:hypothetical protein n=1 Tax=Corynebacterium appendicis TaxID=163202 RepID=UPI00254E35AA|nr:hypothetical protein [Corynebacterium appendicis]MDK8626125.1 hypothetical protein [Corynebacterium appendicis]